MEKRKGQVGNLLSLASGVSCGRAGREPRCPDSKPSAVFTARIRAKFKSTPWTLGPWKTVLVATKNNQAFKKDETRRLFSKREMEGQTCTPWRSPSGLGQMGIRWGPKFAGSLAHLLSCGAQPLRLLQSSNPFLRAVQEDSHFIGHTHLQGARSPRDRSSLLVLHTPLLYPTPTNYTLVTLAFFLFSEPTKLISISGCLHLLFPLSGIMFWPR